MKTRLLTAAAGLALGAGLSACVVHVQSSDGADGASGASMVSASADPGPYVRRRASRIQAAMGTVRRDGLAACVGDLSPKP